MPQSPLIIVTIVVIIAAEICAQTTKPSCNKKPDGCLDPCLFARCRAFPTALCEPYYCSGRCEGVFYINSQRVDCDYNRNATTQIIPTIPIRVCPPEPPTVEMEAGASTTLASCINLCNNCENRGMICCPNRGCGSQCKQPVIWVPWNEPFDKPVNATLKKLSTISPLRLLFGRCPAVTANTTITTCKDACDNCEERGKLCCWNGCGKICLDPVIGSP